VNSNQIYLVELQNYARIPAIVAETVLLGAVARAQLTDVERANLARLEAGVRSALDDRPSAALSQLLVLCGQHKSTILLSGSLTSNRVCHIVYF
jgi:hypothetical protein